MKDWMKVKIKTGADKVVQFWNCMVHRQLVDPNSRRARIFLACAYLLIHFIVGLLVLHIAYDNVSDAVKATQDYGFEVSFEAFYILVGVVWGNLGWDGYHRIKAGASSNEVVKLLYKVTIPAVGLVAVAMNLYIAFNRISGLGLPRRQWFVAYWNDVNLILIGSVAFVVLYWLTPKITESRKSKTKENAGTENTKTSSEKTEKQYYWLYLIEEGDGGKKYAMRPTVNGKNYQDEILSKELEEVLKSGHEVQLYELCQIKDEVVNNKKDSTP